jgi:transposase
MAAVEQRHEGAPSMFKIATDLSSVTTVGLDIAKHIFQVHAVDAAGRVLSAKAVKRKDVLAFFAGLPPCLVGLEACGSAHHWGRELQALGHDVRLMPPAYVKPYVRRQKNDAADAAAICEAVSRPSMRFVAVRSIANQAALMRHKAREMLVGQRTQLLNGLRGHLAEIGVIAAQGPNQARALGEMIADGEVFSDMREVPDCVREALKPLASQIAVLDAAIDALDVEIRALAKADPTAVRLMSIPGVGPLTASAFTASVQDASAFTGPRAFAAFLGLAPRQNSSGGKERLGRISKMGNGYLRKLLVVGAHAVLFHRAKHDDPLRAWAKKLIAAKPFKLVAVALANKLARIIFALMTSGSVYDGKDLQGQTRSDVPAAA